MNLTFKNNFHRSIIFSNIPISGYYRFDNAFQIKKGDISWPPVKQSMSCKEAIVLEYNSDYYRNYRTTTSEQQPDELEESFRHFDYRKELMALLTLVGSANFHEEKSYLLNNKDLGECYFKEDYTVDDLGTNIEINNENMFSNTNYLGQQVNFPENHNLFFTNYFSLDKNNTNRFRMSLMLYYNSIHIREHSASMSYVALISSIENMVDFEGELTGFESTRCDVCSQLKYKLTKRFKDFMTKYCSDDSTEFKRYLGEAYAKRSKVAHLGELFYNDYASTELDIKGNIELDLLKRVVRIALYNWVINAANA